MNENVAVIGLGTMGHGIAQAFATFGHPVHCYDPSPEARETAKARIRENLSREVAAGLRKPDSVETALQRIEVKDNQADALRDARFVTEAAAEDLQLKRELFAIMEAQVSSDIVLASNTSSWPMSQICAKMKTPARVLNTHRFNPPHIVPLVEVVPSQHTDESVVQTTMKLLSEIGKTAIHLRKEVPGFLVNRIQVAMLREILDLLEQGVAPAEDIDRAFRASVGFRSAVIGPLQVYDFAGLDIGSRCYSELIQDMRSDREVHTCVKQLVDQGHLGTKTGQGIYKYTPELIEEKMAARDEGFLAVKKLLHS